MGDKKERRGESGEGVEKEGQKVGNGGGEKGKGTEEKEYNGKEYETGEGVKRGSEGREKMMKEIKVEVTVKQTRRVGDVDRDMGTMV